MRNTLLAASTMCLVAGSALAIPAPDNRLDDRGATPKAATIDGKAEIKVATCGWFVRPGVEIRIRRDRRGRVIQQTDWPSTETYWGCI
ncbi:MAG: hypothetical protein AB7G15_05780 [Alphaproteobacteria bacterium]